MGVNGRYSSLLKGLVLCAVTTSLATPLTATVGSAQSVAVREESVSGTRQVLITVKATQAPLAKVLQDIAAQANLAVAFPGKVSQSSVRVTIDVRDMPLEQVLAKVLDGTGVKAIVAAGAIGFSEREGAPTTSVAQGSISGKVVDGKTRQGLRGATIILSGTNKGTTSNEDGTFRISAVVPGSYTVQVRMLGYVKTARTITVADGQAATLEIAMEPSVNALDQVVVTGTVVPMERRAIPNAMTVITAKEIEQRGITHIDQLFRGDVPGLFVQNTNSDNPLDSVVMFSRGATKFQGGGLNSMNFQTFPATNPIKTYVDGVELANSVYLSQIDPASIERIEILTGPQASTIYGSNAINGVMQIFTKRSGTARTQVTASLMSGLIENNFSPSLAPQHDYAVQANGTEARWSYHVGTSWNYVGPWTPGRRTGRLSGDGGARLNAGALSVDGTFRLGRTKNISGGSVDQGINALREKGKYSTVISAGRTPPTTSRLNGQTLGASAAYAMTPWWSHDVGFGKDVTEIQTLVTSPGFKTPYDTTLLFNSGQYEKTSIRYATTARLQLASPIQLTVTTGVDSWRSENTTVSASPVTMTGTLVTPTAPTITRLLSKNTGAFVQGQLGMFDGVFLTYGLRAEWNPNYGDDAQPNMAPRAGIAYAIDIGPLTAKIRGSYGKSTKPPTAERKKQVMITDILGTTVGMDYFTRYGQFVYQLTNPDLGPEFQQGGEGGLEVYLNTRASLVVTRYNQTVDGLIEKVKVDSVPPLTNPRFGYAPISQYINLGSIRNQGWELQGTVNAGPFTTKGTYSWTKSRIIGITPKYRTFLTGSQYRPGTAFDYLPEHTWALNVMYARAATTLSVNVNGTGSIFVFRDDLAIATLERLPTDRPLITLPDGYRSIGPRYAMADLNLSHRVSPRIEGLIQIQNLTDFYRSDAGSQWATMGRQSKAGVRIRL